jgi:hypothetical protein
MVSRNAMHEGLSRRDLLKGSLFAGGAVLGAAAMPGVAGADLLKATTPTATAAAPASTAATGMNFFTDVNLDFNARFALGAAGYGAAEVGEVMATINLANAEGGTIQSFVHAFWGLAHRVAVYASAERKAGHIASARDAHLRAAEYYAQVLFFILGSTVPDQEAHVYRQCRANWEAYCALAEPRILRVNIPYNGTTIPAYLMRPDDSGRARPTVIVNNGSDAQSVEVFSYGGAAAIERGYNALIFEGPGQGDMLFQRRIPFRPDWEKVITPIVNWLRKRSDVDHERIALTGWSFGGSLVIRAAAFEHRLVGVVADPGVAINWLAYPPVVRNVQTVGDAAAQNKAWVEGIIPELTTDEQFTMKKRTEIFAPEFLADARAGKVFTDYAKFATTMEQFQVENVAAKVTAPTLVTRYEGDEWDFGQGEALYKLITAPKKLQTFTVAQGADFHCAPMAPQYRNEVVFDWLAQHLD